MSQLDLKFFFIITLCMLSEPIVFFVIYDIKFIIAREIKIILDVMIALFWIVAFFVLKF